ncbi:MAG: NADH-quinone oxidoreductase subunit J [Anaerolineaceae bacterium]|nr:NADH-quinone oxidoreductase subunit J [Anaerolineaceae bacterium]
MVIILIAATLLVCAIQAIISPRLLVSAIWLAGASALTAVLLFLLGAPEVAVIELSVGAGLVTVLFIFAINITGDEKVIYSSLVPRPIAILVVGFVILSLGFLNLPSLNLPFYQPSQNDFIKVLWEDRGLDMILQSLLIFAGVMGILSLFANGEVSKKEISRK